MRLCVHATTLAHRLHLSSVIVIAWEQKHAAKLRRPLAGMSSGPSNAVGRDRRARTDGHPEPDESPRITSRQHWPTHDPEDFRSTRLYRSPPCRAALSGKVTVTAAGTPWCTGKIKVVPTFVMRGS